MTDIRDIEAIILARGLEGDIFQDIQDRKEGKTETSGTCPFCGKAGKFSYSSKRPFWRCWSCGRAGNWQEYLAEKRGWTWRESLESLAKLAGVELESFDEQKYRGYLRKASLLENALDIFQDSLARAEDIQGYLEARGYTVEDIVGMGLGAFTDRQGLQSELSREGYTQEEMEASGLLLYSLGKTHTLAIPYHDKAGRLLGLAFRPPISEEERKKQGLSKYLYTTGLDKSQGMIGFVTARGSKSVAVVEGVLDSLYINSRMARDGQKGRPAVSLGGASLSVSHIKLLESTGTQELLLALDMDEAGTEGTEKALRLLLDSRLRAYVVSLPDGYKDPDELVRGQGLAPWLEALGRAERGASWLARRIVSKHDISTDRGLDGALQEAWDILPRLQDKLLRKSFLDSLGASTGLSDDILEQKAQEFDEKASQRASQRLLEGLGDTVKGLAGQGDILGAEEELAQGLQSLRQLRGVQPPSPYSLEALVQDWKQASPGLETGWPELDKFVRVPQGAISIVAGRPGVGKTSFLINLLASLLDRYPGKQFVFMSYEEARRAIAMKLIMVKAGLALHADYNQIYYQNYLRGQWEGQARPEIEEAKSWYASLAQESRLIITDDMLSVEDLAGQLPLLARDGFLGGVLIDYIQRVPVRETARNSIRYLEVKRISGLLLEQAVKLDIPIILGAQFNRETAGKPRLEALRESGDIEQDASLVLGLQAPEEEAEESQQDSRKELRVHVLKQRGGASGGRPVSLQFDMPTLRITSLPIITRGSQKQKR